MTDNTFSMTHEELCGGLETIHIRKYIKYSKNQQTEVIINDTYMGGKVPKRDPALNYTDLLPIDIAIALGHVSKSDQENAAIKTLEADIERLKDRNEMLVSEYNASIKRNQALNSDNNRLADLVREVKTELGHVCGERNELKQRLNQVKPSAAIVRANEILNEEKAALQEQLEGKEKAIAAYQKEVQNHGNNEYTIKKLNQQLTIAQDVSRRMVDAREELKGRVDEACKQRNEAYLRSSGMESKIKDLEAALTGMREARNAYRDSYAKVCNQRCHMEDNIKGLRESIGRLNVQLSNKEIAFNNLFNIQDKLANTLDELRQENYRHVGALHGLVRVVLNILNGMQIVRPELKEAMEIAQDALNRFEAAASGIEVKYTGYDDVKCFIGDWGTKPFKRQSGSVMQVPVTPPVGMYDGDKPEAKPFDFEAHIVTAVNDAIDKYGKEAVDTYFNQRKGSLNAYISNEIGQRITGKKMKAFVGTVVNDELAKFLASAPDQEVATQSVRFEKVGDVESKTIETTYKPVVTIKSVSNRTQ